MQDRQRWCQFWGIIQNRKGQVLRIIQKREYWKPKEYCPLCIQCAIFFCFALLSFLYNSEYLFCSFPLAFGNSIAIPILTISDLPTSMTMNNIHMCAFILLCRCWSTCHMPTYHISLDMASNRTIAHIIHTIAESNRNTWQFCKSRLPGMVRSSHGIAIAMQGRRQCCYYKTRIK